jgi:hypothetical protein
MSMARQCDRCGKLCKPKNFSTESYRYTVVKDLHPYPAVNLDLCEDCQESLVEWLNEVSEYEGR